MKKIKFKKVRLMTNSNHDENDKLNKEYKKLTLKDIETELKRETYKSKYIKILKSTIYGLIIIAAIAALTATLILPVLEISTSSMEPTYKKGEIVLAIKTKKINQEDVIAFYHGNKILIKRVIATSGSWVDIKDDGTVYVDGYKLNETYISNKTNGDSDLKYPYQVPNESFFVLSDNRIELIDSRNSQIGAISKDNLIGKVIFRIWPLK